MLGIIYNMGIANEFYPLLIFMGVGAMTDYGPLLANPKTALLGAAAQYWYSQVHLSVAAALSQYTDLFDFTLQQCSAISIIGGADGTNILSLSLQLKHQSFLEQIADAAYSYMALVPVFKPPIMRALTNKGRSVTVVMKTGTSPVHQDGNTSVVIPVQLHHALVNRQFQH